VSQATPGVASSDELISRLGGGPDPSLSHGRSAPGGSDAIDPSVPDHRTSWSWNTAQTYSESKLHVTTLALTLVRVWPDVLSNAVDPGWVPTKMGGATVSGDLQMGYLTQT
jgi:NAD(P)-dependent dehydrogenase (short-subunit alcohol dehydrogenase family)